MEIFEDKAIVDLKKYKKLVEFYEKIPFDSVYCSYDTYGGNNIVKYKTQSEAVKEVIKYNQKLASINSKLERQNFELQDRINNLIDENRNLEERYKKEINDHRYTKEKLTSSANALTALTKVHNDLLGSIKNWSILKFLSERKKRREKNKLQG
jgi:t-SNARE complex subunit (syntaxin)